MLHDVTRADNSATEFKFNAYKSDLPVDWSESNFESKIHTSSYDYTIATNPEAHVIAERMKFLNSYKRK
jgi:hypothetical protein